MIDFLLLMLEKTFNFLNIIFQLSLPYRLFCRSNEKRISNWRIIMIADVCL